MEGIGAGIAAQQQAAQLVGKGRLLAGPHDGLDHLIGGLLGSVVANGFALQHLVNHGVVDHRVSIYTHIMA